MSFLNRLNPSGVMKRNQGNIRLTVVVHGLWQLLRESYYKAGATNDALKPRRTDWCTIWLWTCSNDHLANSTINSACPSRTEENHNTVPGINSWSPRTSQDGRCTDASKTQENVTPTRTLAALKSHLPARRVHICFRKRRHSLLG